MKKQELLAVKKLEVPTLLERVDKIRGELADLVLDRNMGKLKDIQMLSKRRRDLAQVLTILRQKQLLENLESRIENQGVGREDNKDTKIKKEVKRQKVVLDNSAASSRLKTSS